MIFKVSKDVKGSLIIGSINKVVHGGQHVSIPDDKLKSSDVVNLIKQNKLLPSELQGDGVPKEPAKQEVPELIAVITNETNGVMVIGDVSIRPRSTISVDISRIDSPHLQTLINKKYVTCIINNKKVAPSVVENKEENKKEDKEVPEKVEDVEEDIEETDVVEKQPKAKVWDFQQQKTTKAEKVPTTRDIKTVDDPNLQLDDKEEVEEVEKKTVAKKKKVAKKSKIAKKTSKKEDSGEVKKVANKKTKKIEPVGERREEKTDDAFIEDKKPSDTLQDIINNFIENNET